MRRFHLLAAALICGSFATAAAADCASEIDALAMGGGKDATLAPLSDTATPQTGGEMAKSPDATAANAGKDGSLTPMGASPDVATSAQDAQAQSEGGKTAAEQAAGAKGTETRTAALDEARAALAAGDEEGCLAAVEKAKGM